MMKVKNLYIYPVKSVAGIERSSAEVLQKGFRYDRRWMLVDENGQFITQRVEHKLALLQTEVCPDGIIISERLNPGRSVRIPYEFQANSSISVSIWDDTVTARVGDTKAADWFSRFLNRDCRLVFMPETELRPVDTRFASNNEQVSFADAFPYLLISQASLDDLNSKLKSPVPMNRFRPSVVVSDTKAFEEDTWSEIKIANVRFKVAKPCARCILTTIDQDTGIRSNEPLATLAKYRTINNKVLFGQNLIALNEGTINVGDSVEIISLKQS